MRSLLSILVVASYSSTPCMGTEVLTSSDYPSWFVAIFWTLLLIISAMFTITQAGHFHICSQTSTYNSAVSLIFIDTVAYVSIMLSTVLLLLSSFISKPWESITITFIAPLTSLIASVIFGLSMQVQERSILTLWLRSSTLLSVQRLTLDTNSVRTAVVLSSHSDPSIPTEDPILALMRTNHPDGVAAAAKSKGSKKPFFTAFHTWLRTAKLPRTTYALAYRRVRGTCRLQFIPRQSNTKEALLELEKVGKHHLRQNGYSGIYEEDVIIACSLDGCVPRAPCKTFGKMWLRVARQPGLDKNSEGWWFIGADIVQSLKCCIGVEQLSRNGRFDDAKCLWDWVDKLGYGWRKEFQLKEVAGELAHAGREDEEVVIDKALFLAGDGCDIAATNVQMQLAVEANAVACLGLAIRVTVEELQKRLDCLCIGVEDILKGVGENMSGIWMIREDWPEDAMARLLFRWVGEAAIAMGRPGGPGVEI